VLFPTGYRNRYHFPVKSIVERYRQAEVEMFDTASSGALTVRNDPLEGVVIEEYRKTHMRYWHSEPLH
jgi:competence protein ComEC